MSKLKHQDIESFIRDDFINDFMDAYGLCVSLTNVHPEQANNEARNAFVHLGRATTLSGDDHPEAEIKRAKRHIERGKRDCFKLSIITIIEQINSIITRVEITEGRISSSFKIRLRTISKERRDVFKKETQGSAVADDLEAVLVSLLELEDDLLTTYNDPGTVIPTIKQYYYKLKNYVFAAMFAVFCSFLAAYMFAVAFPDSSKVSDLSKQYLQFFLPQTNHGTVKKQQQSSYEER